MQKVVLVACFALLGMILITQQSCKKTSVPTACFTVASDSILIGKADSFTNCSVNAHLSNWYFGDGDTDFVNQSPVHSYSKPGNYPVKLIVEDNTGKTSSKIIPIVVLPLLTSQNFTGTYTGTQTCLLSGDTAYTIGITGDGYLSLYISNLFNTAQSFNASISDSTAIISPQGFTKSGQNYLLQGSLAIAAHNALSINLVITSFGKRDVCQGNFIKP